MTHQNCERCPKEHRGGPQKQRGNIGGEKRDRNDSKIRYLGIGPYFGCTLIDAGILTHLAVHQEIGRADEGKIVLSWPPTKKRYRLHKHHVTNSRDGIISTIRHVLQIAERDPDPSGHSERVLTRKSNRRHLHEAANWFRGPRPTDTRLQIKESPLRTSSCRIQLARAD